MFGFSGQHSATLPAPPPPQLSSHQLPGQSSRGASNGSMQSSASEALYEAKYNILNRKCMQVKEETDRIYSNLLHSKKLLKRLLHERRLLAERLERYGDQFGDVDLPLFSEEDFAYEVLLGQKKTVQDANSPGTPTSQASNSVPRRASNSAASFHKTPPSSVELGVETVPVTKGRKKSSGTPRTKKDPEAPRKPVNAYFIFCEQRRADVQRQMMEERQGDVDRKEVTRKLSQLWLDLPQEEKKTFYTLYDIEKTRYDAEMKEYSASRQTLLSNSSVSATASTGLPPPTFSNNGEVSNPEQPAPKRVKKSPRNGPSRPGSQQQNHSQSGVATPSVPSNTCSPSPSICNDNSSNICLATDTLLGSASNDMSAAISSPPQRNSTTEDNVFLLDAENNGMDCLELSLPSGDVLMLSATAGDDTNDIDTSVVDNEATAAVVNDANDEPPSRTGIIVDPSLQSTFSPHTASNEWHHVFIGDDVPVVAAKLNTSEDDMLKHQVKPVDDSILKEEELMMKLVESGLTQNCDVACKNELPSLSTEAMIIADIPLPQIIAPPTLSCNDKGGVEEASGLIAPQPPPSTTC